MRSQQRLFSKYISELPEGTLTWIGLRPGHKQEMIIVDEALAIANLGLEGDHRSIKTPGSARQVTLISEEYIDLIKHFSGIDSLEPSTLRRNLVVKNVNLTALRYQQFRIGSTLLQATALCHPCVRMEKALGKGGIAAMLGHGGLCCSILEGGTLKLGDKLKLEKKQADLF